MEYKAISGASGYFLGRLDWPDELTIAFLGENEEFVYGLATLLEDIGPDNLRVVFKENPCGTISIIVQDKRDPSNFNDIRERPLDHATRFLAEFQEDRKAIITVGDLDMNLAYDRLRLEIHDIEFIPRFLN
ncbi:MAG: hypothetical protein M0Z31_09180 [Clostridia bacterium]|nr:hypothetical protein [Clostridia bacterium]